MVQFWLNNPMSLLSPDNLKFDGLSKPQTYIQYLNIIALLSIIIGISLAKIKNKPEFFLITVIVLSLTILIKSNISASSFEKVESNLSTNFDTGAYLVKSVDLDDPSGMNNMLYVNEAYGFNKGDIIALSNNNTVLETSVISDIKYTIDTLKPVLILLRNLKGKYSKYTTKILKVSDSSPDLVEPPDGNISIQKSGNTGSSDPISGALASFPKFNLPNQNRYDWNLENSTLVPGTPENYKYQGQPYGDLKCRESTVENPMGTINVTEYDNAPEMFGTCNVAELGPNGINNDHIMTTNQEATVSQRVNDLLFHKGNSQSQFSPVAIDTLPDNQEAFAHFCYRSPTNLVNPKYASIFVNDPDKYKIVAKLARATGTENGGGGGGGGRP
jgi:hypothetical protein